MDNGKTPQALPEHRSRLQRLGLIVTGVGLGSALAYLISKTLRKEKSSQPQLPDHIVDDRGTGQGNTEKTSRSRFRGQR